MAYPRRKPIPAAVLALFSSSQLALAQSEPAPAALPEIRVQGAQEGFRRESTGSATRTETPFRDIPQFINSIPEQVIQERGVSNLQDALRTVPGISYAAAEGGTQSNQVVYLRGFPLNGDTYSDGIRELGEYNRDLFATETVEVLKGPSALLFGRGGSGGIVNQITKWADLIPRKEIAIQFGSFHQKRLTADVNFPVGESSALRLIGLAEESGSYRHPQDVDKRGFAPSFRYGIGRDTELSFGYYYLKTHDVTDYGQPTLSASASGTGKAAMPPVSPRKYYGFANHDFADHETQIGTARIDHRFNEAVSLHNTLRAARFKRRMEATVATLNNTDALGNPLAPSTPLSLLLVNRRHDTGRNRDNDDDTLFNQTDLNWKLKTGGVRHTLITGMELGRERIDRVNYALDANPAVPGVQAPSALTPFLDPDPYTRLAYTRAPNLRALGEAHTIAFYVQDQLELSEKWKALVGLRWERYHADVRTRDEASGTTATGPFSRTDRMVSGRVGLIWQPTERQSYYVSIANSYNPSGELGVYGSTSTSLSAATENLDPEENRNYEIGAHWDMAPGLQLRSALFRTQKTHQRIENSISGVLELAGKRRVEGIELELSGSLTPNWEIIAGMAVMDGRIVKANVNQGNRPLGVPDASGSVWTVYRWGGGWEVGGGVVASSGYYLTDANVGKVPAYAVFDATAAYVQPHYEVRLNLYNLTDKTYYLGGYQNSPNRVIPGMPRAATVTLRYLF
jgi:catecholate siderophore receptor